MVVMVILAATSIHHFSDRAFTLSQTRSAGNSRFYCPRPGLQSTKSNACVSRKLAIEMASALLGCDASDAELSRLRGDHTNSDNLARLQVSVLQKPQPIEFFMVRREQAWSKLAFAAIDFNDNKSGVGDLPVTSPNP